MEKKLIASGRYLLCGCFFLVAGCCSFTGDDCIGTREFNERYIDQEKKLQQEKLEREIKQSSERAPVPPEVPKPDYSWKPWEQPERLADPVIGGKNEK